MEAELGRGAPAPPQHAAHGPVAASNPGIAELGVVERFIVDGESLGSFFLRVLIHGAVGRATGTRILERGRRLDAEEAEG